MVDANLTALAVREALLAMEKLAYRRDSGARLVVPQLIQGGIHNPAIQRASRIAGIGEAERFKVSRQIGHRDLMGWASRRKLFLRDAIRGISELYDDALYDHVNEIPKSLVLAAAEDVRRYGQRLARTNEKDFYVFPFRPSARMHMAEGFATNWTGGRPTPHQTR